MARVANCLMSASVFAESTMPETSGLKSQSWMWRGLPIAYYRQGDRGPAVLFVHGFGASGLHWRKNLAGLGEGCRCYAIDLLGFGESAKPMPGQPLEYTFETWAAQIVDFCRQVVGEPVVLVGNSIGCVAAMQAVVDEPAIALSIVLIDCSLRLLHDRKRATLAWYQRLGAPILQQVLGVKWIGQQFFNQLARPQTVRKILLQAYGRPEAVTDELIELLLKPARDRGAVDVFLAFIRYSQGPLPEDLLPVLPCPALILWGTADPWESIDLGREFATFSPVQQFIPLEGLGHCPHDEAPEIVNPILQDWMT